MLDSLDYSTKLMKSWAFRDRTVRVFTPGAYDDFERVYAWLWIAAKHGLSKEELLAARWGHFYPAPVPHLLVDGARLPLDRQDLSDLDALAGRLAVPPRKDTLVFAGISSYKINNRIMDRWVDRAELARLRPRYEDLVLGFAAMVPEKAVRISV